MKKRSTDEQIIQMLKEQEAGEKTADLCRRYGISQGTFYKYKSKYGGHGAIRRRAAASAGGREWEAKETVGRDHARRSNAPRCKFKKVVTPGAKRQAVEHLRKTHGVTLLRARISGWWRIHRCPAST